MVLHKQVNGNKVQLSEEEEAKVRAEWAKNEGISSKEQELEDLIAEVPSMEERLKALEFCMLNHVPSVKNANNEEKDESILLLEKCSELAPQVKDKKKEVEEARKA